MISAAPPLHRPRRCPKCRRSSTAIVEGRCLACREPETATVRPVTGKCLRCREPLLGTVRPRKVCERCRLTLANAP